MRFEKNSERRSGRNSNRRTVRTSERKSKRRTDGRIRLVDPLGGGVMPSTEALLAVIIKRYGFIKIVADSRRYLKRVPKGDPNGIPIKELKGLVKGDPRGQPSEVTRGIQRANPRGITREDSRGDPR